MGKAEKTAPTMPTHNMKLSAEDAELSEYASMFDDVIASPTASKEKKKRKALKAAAMPDYIKEDHQLRKYWAQRYRLFSKYDLGIKLDRGSFYISDSTLVLSVVLP